MSKETTNCNDNKSAEVTLKCLIHKARATKLAIGKYCAK